MGLIDRLLIKRLDKLLKERSVGSQVYGELLKNVQNRPVYFTDNIDSYVKEGYLYNPLVYSIVSFIAQKASSIPWGVYEVKSDKALQLYKSANRYDFSKRVIKTKALIEIKDHELSQLFITPNNLQGWAEFCEQVIGFKLVTGNSYIQCMSPTSGLNKGLVRELWHIPTQIIHPVAGDRTTPVKGYQYLQERDLIPVDQIIHLKYWTPEYWNGAFLLGLSPIRAAKRIVTKSNSSYDSFVSSFQNMGAYGIISGDSKTDDQMLTEEQAEKIEERFRRKTGPKNWGKPIITSAALKWQQMGMSPVDLNIIESDKMDLRSLCSVYHVPSELFNDASNKTYSNTKEAGSAVYTNAVLPALNQLRDAFNLFINPRYEGKVYVDYDASMISELQDDLNYMTQALSGAWWLTPNERRDMMNFGMDEKNTLMDEYWLPVGLSPISGIGVDDEAIEEAAKRLGINDYKQ